MLTPYPRQHDAITAPPGPVLVLAGPGAGKTFCLIERVGFLIERLGIAPARICAFTFTNRAAEEITHRLSRELGPHAEHITGGTIHAYCAKVLREFTGEAGLERGFGIADEEYQRSILAQLQQPRKWHTNLLNRFTLHRFCSVPLHPADEKTFARYLAALERRNMVDFDQLVTKTRELLVPGSLTGSTLRSRYDYVLVDEFQDLNPAQYDVVTGLAHVHRNIYCVGDDEQSIFSWTGADPRLFTNFGNDFAPALRVTLDENRRCPKGVMEYATRLVRHNPTLFQKDVRVVRESPFAVRAVSFADDTSEVAWLLNDVQNDRQAHGTPWGEFGVLYRRHEIGDALETQFLIKGIPCRLAQGRALSEDPVVQYVLAALRVIASPDDRIHRAQFFRVVLPQTLFKAIEAQSEEQRTPILEQLTKFTRALPRDHVDARKIRRGSYALRNLAALGKQHRSLVPLVEDLLSQRVGEYRTVLESSHEDISDPKAHRSVEELAGVMRDARDAMRPLWIPPMGGSEVAMKNLLQAAGPYRVAIGPVPPEGSVPVRPDAGGDLDLSLALFKAAQLIAADGFADSFRDFTVVDTETTGRDVHADELVELAAVRVRNGEIASEFTTLVKPRVAISSGAARVHGITADEVRDAPFFEDVWPAFRAFIGSDILVAHNGYQFDFPILRRMSRDLEGGGSFTTYDSLPLARELRSGSRTLVDLAHAFDIDTGTSHRALDDCRTLARVFPRLNKAKVDRARKTGLANLLDHLGIALWLQREESLGEEARRFRQWTRVHPFFASSEALEQYRALRDTLDDPASPDVDELIQLLGGVDLMEKIRAHKTADQRYPQAMARLRRLIEAAPEEELSDQIVGFLERVVLSRWDGTDKDSDRVNLLTLHATKGLEFSRVYIVGAEDAELPGLGNKNGVSERELEEARRLLYVGMTRAKDRLVLTRVVQRRDKATGGQRFLEEMGLTPDEYP
ncbi:MAG: UvrD-helicase domain-containing protein [Gemmatimonadaceae bacterium]